MRQRFGEKELYKLVIKGHILMCMNVLGPSKFYTGNLKSSISYLNALFCRIQTLLTYLGMYYRQGQYYSSLIKLSDISLCNSHFKLLMDYHQFNVSDNFSAGCLPQTGFMFVYVCVLCTSQNISTRYLNLI